MTLTLWGLWYVSLAFAGVSVAVMLLLVLRRVGQNRLAARRDARRRAASAALLTYLEGGNDAAAVRQAAGGRADVIDDLVFEMRELVRGGDAARLIEVARALGGFERTAKGLRRRNPATRAAAARRIAMFGSDAVAPLTQLLRDRNIGVRITAAIELIKLDAAPPLDRLAEALSVGDVGSEELRRIFRSAVARDIDRAAGMVEDEWTADALRILLLDGLAAAGALSALPSILVALQSEAPAVRAEVMRTLATLAHPSTAAAVTDGLHDAHWWVRAQAANAARRIGIVQAVAPLTELLNDEQWWVRFRAAEALSALGEGGRQALADHAGRPGRAGQVSQLVLAEKGLA